ncbi:MAG: DUF4890 domain-containing protein [Bacteroidia bacterium]|nr:DUF4890 domain-containing protein [Bacteroidia bacterium]
MKKLGFLLVVFVMVGGMALAQKPQKAKKMDPKVRVERMTERMAKELSLNDAQKKQLQEANGVLMAQMDSCHLRPMVGKKGKCPMVRKKGCCQMVACDSIAPGKHQRMKVVKRSKEERAKVVETMKSAHQAYEAQLKRILTKEQFEVYTKKKEARQESRKERREAFKKEGNKRG